MLRYREGRSSMLPPPSVSPISEVPEERTPTPKTPGKPGPPGSPRAPSAHHTPRTADTKQEALVTRFPPISLSGQLTTSFVESTYSDQAVEKLAQEPEPDYLTYGRQSRNDEEATYNAYRAHYSVDDDDDDDGDSDESQESAVLEKDSDQYEEFIREEGMTNEEAEILPPPLPLPRIADVQEDTYTIDSMYYDLSDIKSIREKTLSEIAEFARKASRERNQDRVLRLLEQHRVIKKSRLPAYARVFRDMIMRRQDIERIYGTREDPDVKTHEKKPAESSRRSKSRVSLLERDSKRTSSKNSRKGRSTSRSRKSRNSTRRSISRNSDKDKNVKRSISRNSRTGKSVKRSSSRNSEKGKGGQRSSSRRSRSSNKRSTSRDSEKQKTVKRSTRRSQSRRSVSSNSERSNSRRRARKIKSRSHSRNSQTGRNLKRSSSRNSQKGKDTKRSSSRNSQKGKDTKRSSSRNSQKGKDTKRSSSRNSQKGKDTKRSSSRNAEKGRNLRRSSSRNSEKGKDVKRSSSRNSEKGKNAKRSNSKNYDKSKAGKRTASRNSKVGKEVSPASTNMPPPPSLLFPDINADVEDMNAISVQQVNMAMAIEEIADEIGYIEQLIKETQEEKLQVVAAEAREMFPDIAVNDFYQKGKFYKKKIKKKKDSKPPSRVAAKLKGKRKRKEKGAKKSKSKSGSKLQEEIVKQIRQIEEASEHDTSAMMDIVQQSFMPAPVSDKEILRRLNNKMLKKLEGSEAVEAVDNKINELKMKIRITERKRQQMIEEKKVTRLKYERQSDTAAVNDLRLAKDKGWEREQSAMYKALNPKVKIRLHVDDLEQALLRTSGKKPNREALKFIYHLLQLPAGCLRLDFKTFCILASFMERLNDLSQEKPEKNTVTRMQYDALTIDLQKSMDLFRMLREDIGEDVGSCYAVRRADMEIELKAGGITDDLLITIMSKLDRYGRGIIEFVDFLIYAPLFSLVHRKICDNPL